MGNKSSATTSYTNPHVRDVPQIFNDLVYTDKIRDLIGEEGFNGLIPYQQLIIYILFGYSMIGVPKVYRGGRDHLFRLFESYGLSGYNYLSYLFSYIPVHDQIQIVKKEGKDGDPFFKWWVQNGGWDILNEVSSECNTDTQSLEEIRSMYSVATTTSSVEEL